MMSAAGMRGIRLTPSLYTRPNVLRTIRIPRRFTHSQSSTSTTSTSNNSSPPSTTTALHARSTTLRLLFTPFRAYGRAQDSNPYIVQFISALVIYGCGDLAVQYIQRDEIALTLQSSDHHSPDHRITFADTYSPIRTLRSLTIGAISCIPSYHWFLYLSRHFNLQVNAANVLVSTARRAFIASLGVKVIVNQVAFAPIFNTYFFAMHSLLSTSPFPPRSFEQARTAVSEAVTRVKNTVPRSVASSWQFWPMVTVFNFTFVPEKSRSVFAGVVAIGWQTYLGLLNQKEVKRRALAAKMEREAMESGAGSAVGVGG